ncbi:MAG TPA: hypothetical protein VEF07_06870 [Candidatus Binataceae bacterium]|nr:hypothetical protein [Candidatus Binataceae bacterium]
MRVARGVSFEAIDAYLHFVVDPGRAVPRELNDLRIHQPRREVRSQHAPKIRFDRFRPFVGVRQLEAIGLGARDDLGAIEVGRKPYRSQSDRYVVQRRPGRLKAGLSRGQNEEL